MVSLVLLVLTGLFAWSASRGVVASSLSNLFLGENPNYDSYKKRVEQFANDEAFAVAFDDPAPFSLKSIERLKSIVKEIEAIKDIGRVESLLNAQHIHGTDESLIVEKYYKQALKNPKTKEEVLKILQDDILYRDLLISADGRHVLVLIEFAPSKNRPAERGPKVVEEVVRVFAKHGLSRTQIHLAGFMASKAEAMRLTQYNFSHLFPFVCLALLIVLYLMFNRLWPVSITLLVSGVTVIWTFGFSVMLDEKINILIAMVPSVIVIIATSDVIHLCSTYMLELARGLSKKEAISQSAQEVGRACLMTSATTFVGFVSLSIVPIPAFRQLGLVLGFGVGVALLIALTLTPILFSFMKQPRPWSDKSSRVQSLFSSALKGVNSLADRYPWPIVLGFLVIFGLASYAVSFLHLETEFNKRLAEDNPIRMDENYFRQHFAGQNFLEVFVDTKEENGLLDPEVYASIDKFQKRIQNLPDVDKTVSLVDLINNLDRVLKNDSGSNSREQLAQYLLMFEMSGGEELERLIDFDRRSMRLAVRLSNNAARMTYQTGMKVAAIAAETFKSTAQVNVEVSGLTYLIGDFLDEIEEGQRQGLMLAFIVIFVLMVFWTRSLRIGFFSMVPNLLPILALGGLAAALWDTVDTDMIAVALIAVGIGVDDTIHFLMRLDAESKKTDDTKKAMASTFHFSGRAIVITSVILGFGFLPFAVSDYQSIQLVGTLIPFTLLVALVADLFLVPAMTNLGWIRFKNNTD
jgi:hydrophobe/amphiphile efflux-3 (HAE3) family protein